MNKDEKRQIKSRLLRHYDLNRFNSSRLKRLMHSPVYTGRFFLMNLVARIVPFKVRKVMPWGATMRYYLPEANQIYYYDFWELNLANMFIDTLEEGDTFIDVGAHVGYYSSLAARLVGASGKIIAIEPTPRTFMTLRENLEARPNAVALNYALGANTGEITFIDHGPRHSAFNEVDYGQKEFMIAHPKVTRMIVPMRTLDDICAEYGAKPKLVKIDAEGSESHILRGATKLLEEVHPIISVEIADSKSNPANAKETFEILTNHGYLPFIMEENGSLRRHDGDPRQRLDNVVFIHE